MFKSPYKSGSSSLPGIHVHYFSTYDGELLSYHHAPGMPSITAEELCVQLCSQHLVPAFGSLAVHLCALQDMATSQWLAPNHKFDSHSTRTVSYILRIRFIPAMRHLKSLHLKHPAAYQYFSLQCQYDFLNETIRYKQDSGTQDHKLGLVVLSMVIHAKLKNFSIDAVSKMKHADFMPKTVKEAFSNIFEQKRLKTNIRKKLEETFKKYEDDQVQPVQWIFTTGVIKYSTEYCIERFNVSQGEQVQIVVDPHHKTCPGIYMIQGKEKKLEHICEIGDCDIRILPSQGEASKGSSPVTVLVNHTKGASKMIKFENEVEAKSFASLVDGYYRLSVDFHNRVCSDIQSPMLKKLQVLAAHGPVSKEWAKKRLKDKHAVSPQYNYLLKQQRNTPNLFVLFYISPSSSVSEPSIVPVKQNDDNKFQLEGFAEQPTFTNVVELLRYYKSQHDCPIKLEHCVRPSNPLDPLLYICLTEDSNESLDTTTRGQQVSIVSPCHIKIDKILGEGRFTQIKGAQLATDNGLDTVAIKCIRHKCRDDSYSYGLLQSLLLCAQTVSVWRSPYIVRVHAICLQPTYLIEDWSDLGPLDCFLAKAKDSFNQRQLMIFAEQFMNALYYLEEFSEVKHGFRGYVHGNIRARNLLVFSGDGGSLMVKLADPGMVNYTNVFDINNEINRERLPWLGQELHENLSHMTTHSDMYAAGTTLWEMFSKGERPFHKMRPSEESKHILDVWSDPGRPLLPCPKLCPEGVYQAMLGCWVPDPSQRETAKNVLRMIRDDAHGISHSVNEYSDVMMNSGDDLLYNHSMMSSGTTAIEEQNRQNVLSETHHTRHMAHSTSQSSTSSSAPTSPGSSAGGPPSTCDSQSPLIPPGFNISYPSTSSLGESLSTDNTDTTLLGYPDSHGGSGDLTRQGMSTRPLPPTPAMLTTQILHSQINVNLSKDSPNSLGKGHFGEVYLGIYMLSEHLHDKVAIKVLKEEMRASKNDDDELCKEVDMMSKLKHPHIVNIVGYCRLDDRIPGIVQPTMLVMEYISKGSLKVYLNSLKREQPNHLDIFYKFCYEIALGMNYLHSQKVVHRDLAARNVLVTNELKMKISDFGLARHLDEKDYYRMHNTHTAFAAFWSAPESLGQYKFSAKSDMWSYGVTVWEIFSYGSDPNFCEHRELLDKLQKATRLPQKTHCPPNLYNNLLLQLCWKFMADERGTLDDVMEMLCKQNEPLKAKAQSYSSC